MLALSLLVRLCFSGCEVFVMAPLAILDDNQHIKDKDKITRWFDQLQTGNVDGLMIDVWWGLVERSTKSYKWDGYVEIFNMLKQRGLKIVPVMSFHKCGGNCGDDCNIPIPSFVLSSSLKPFYTDENGNYADEYISLGFDSTSIEGRTPLQMYKDFMSAFKAQFSDLLNDGTIVEIEVGCGPAGELRYPSYPSKYWSYPGCGGFQAYDNQMTNMLVSDAQSAGVPNYGHHPQNTGGYNARPDGSQFWTEGASDSWDSDYGSWYTKWYAQKLIEHGTQVQKIARSVFGPKVELSAKISGVHWWYMTRCHCAELTAGLLNLQNYDGYRDIMKAFRENDIHMCFTCLEMNPDGSAGSNPPYLVQQIANDCKWAGLPFEGENALECYDWSSFMRIKAWVSQGLTRYTHLRMGDALMADGSWNTFKSFVSEMHNA